MNPHVYLLVKIVKQSKKKFLDWCQFHANFGFAKIYVFDDGSTEWYDDAASEVQSKYKNFVFLNRSERWNNRGEILGAFCKHCVNGDWGMVIASNEFIWTKKWQKFDVRSLVAAAIQNCHAHAITFYKEYVIENDDYQFKTKDFNTYSANVKECPCTSLVMFSVQDKKICPMSSAVVPLDKARWFDSNWEPLSVEKLMSGVPTFSSYPVRIFKLLEKGSISDVELSNFTYDDTTLWPLYCSTFTDFVPKYPEKSEYKKQVEAEVLQKAEEAKLATVLNEKLDYEIDGEVIGRIVSAIMRGVNFEGVVAEVKETNISVSDDDIKIIYDRECYNIIMSNVPYQRLIDMMMNGVKQKDMLKELHVSTKTLKRMKDVLASIPAEIKGKFDKANVADEVPEEDVIPDDTEEA